MFFILPQEDFEKLSREASVVLLSILEPQNMVVTSLDAGVEIETSVVKAALKLALDRQ